LLRSWSGTTGKAAETKHCKIFLEMVLPVFDIFRIPMLIQKEL